MPGKPSLAGPFQPGEIQGSPILKRMNIHPKPNPRHSLHRSRLQG
jgi:hypothetical protein